MSVKWPEMATIRSEIRRLSRLEVSSARARYIERIESVTDADNVPSQRVLEKSGFRREGVLRKRCFDRGEYRDEYIYSLLREEWEKARESR